MPKQLVPYSNVDPHPDPGEMPPRHPVQAAPATEMSISCRMSFLNFAPSPWAISASNASPVQRLTADVANAASTAKTMASQNKCASGRAMDAMARTVEAADFLGSCLRP